MYYISVMIGARRSIFAAGRQFPHSAQATTHFDGGWRMADGIITTPSM
jgi:hypothetical protein